MRSLRLRPDVIAAMVQWEIRVLGKAPREISQDILSERNLDDLQRLALPGEDLNDTILRLIPKG